MKKLTSNDFLKKVIEIHGNKYDYSLVNYINIRSKIDIICKIHGVFSQVASSHSCGVGCPSCAGVKKRTTNDFVTKAILRHGNTYDYSLIKFPLISNKVVIICQKHGEFHQRPNDHLQGKGCPICKESHGERKIRLFLEKENIKFIRQYRFNDCRNKNPLPFDFYLPEHNICIEFNGRQHYEVVNDFGGDEEFIRVLNSDDIKLKFCNENNIKLIVVKYNEKINLMDSILV